MEKIFLFSQCITNTDIKFSKFPMIFKEIYEISFWFNKMFTDDSWAVPSTSCKIRSPMSRCSHLKKITTRALETRGNYQQTEQNKTVWQEVVCGAPGGARVFQITQKRQREQKRKQLLKAQNAQLQCLQDISESGYPISKWKSND